MNKYQRIVVIVAAVNIALMLFFPPFLDNPIRRGVMPSFEGFYPLVSAFDGKRIHNELLTLQIMFVVINGLMRVRPGMQVTPKEGQIDLPPPPAASEG